MRAWLALLACCLFSAAVAAEGLTPPAWHRSVAASQLAAPGWLAQAAQLDRLDAQQLGAAPSSLPLTEQLQAVWAGSGLLIEETGASRAWLPRLAALCRLIGHSLALLVENSYERVIGRLSEAGEASPIDAYVVGVERDYVLFQRYQPWYRFDFATRLAGLWQAWPDEGRHAWRTWERRWFLSGVWGTKALLASAWRVLDPASEPAAAASTAVVVDRWLAPQSGVWPDVERIRSYRDSSALLRLSRGTDVSTRLLAMALEGAEFIEIGGNELEAPILLVLRAPAGWQLEQAEAELLLRQPVQGNAAEQHVLLRTTVGSLARQLRESQAAGLLLEKVFDY